MPRKPGTRHVVAPVADLPPGQRKIVKVKGREIGVFNVDGALYALRNACPHKGGPLCLGRLRPLVVAPDVYCVAHERESEVLKCPWHNYEFDIRTGQALFDPRLRVRAYPVRQEGDEIVIYTD
ncbi:MAG: Rieske (2Fe-2S) protein [Candidatus Latescibacteria bacterium]|nr:Rieske (2Fe-2S) protein [Candidatus Latescibacterota bacterium]